MHTQVTSEKEKHIKIALFVCDPVIYYHILYGDTASQTSRLTVTAIIDAAASFIFHIEL